MIWLVCYGETGALIYIFLKWLCDFSQSERGDSLGHRKEIKKHTVWWTRKCPNQIHLNTLDSNSSVIQKARVEMCGFESMCVCSWWKQRLASSTLTSTWSTTGTCGWRRLTRAMMIWMIRLEAVPSHRHTNHIWRSCEGETINETRQDL